MTKLLSGEPMSTAARNKMAMTYGLILGIIYIILVTLSNQFATQLVLYGMLKFAGYIVFLVILGFMLANIRKANGGYIQFREVLGAAFVIVLVSNVLSYTYTYLYIYVIDPGMTDRVKEASMLAMEKAKLPDDRIDEAIDAIEKSKKFDLGKTVLGFFTVLLFDTFCSVILSLIIKKERPVFEHLQ